MGGTCSSSDGIGVSNTITNVVPPFTYFLKNELTYGPNRDKSIELLNNVAATSTLRELIAHNSWHIMCALLCDEADAEKCTAASTDSKYQVDLLDVPMECTVTLTSGDILPPDRTLSDLGICDQSRLVLGGCDVFRDKTMRQLQQDLIPPRPIGNLVTRLPLFFSSKVVRVGGTRFVLLRANLAWLALTY